MKYYAHSKDTVKSEWHLLKNHLMDTAKIAETFAKRFGAGELGYIAGLLHDIGKYSDDFQKRLQGEKIRVNHSTAGALEALKLHKTFGIILAYVIAGHHCGLTNWGSKVDESSLAGRLTNRRLPDYSAYTKEIVVPKLKEIPSPLKKYPSGRGFSAQFFIRFLYSSLVDADFLDTEQALNIQKAKLRENSNVLCLRELESLLDKYLAELTASAKNTPVNMLRNKILNVCRENARSAPGLFTLTVPTGGGKTLSSLAFALKHALTYDKDSFLAPQRTWRKHV